MRNRSVLPFVALLVTLGFAPYVEATRWSPGWAQASAPAAKSARIWEGRNAEFEAFIHEAPIDHIEDVPLGVTHPKRAYFNPGGLVASVAWKVLPPGRPAGYWESYKSEIAAYELDKVLGMG